MLRHQFGPDRLRFPNEVPVHRSTPQVQSRLLATSGLKSPSPTFGSALVRNLCCTLARTLFLSLVFSIMAVQILNCQITWSTSDKIVRKHVDFIEENCEDTGKNEVFASISFLLDDSKHATITHFGNPKQKVSPQKNGRYPVDGYLVLGGETSAYPRLFRIEIEKPKRDEYPQQYEEIIEGTRLCRESKNGKSSEALGLILPSVTYNKCYKFIFKLKEKGGKNEVILETLKICFNGESGNWYWPNTASEDGRGIASVELSLPGENDAQNCNDLRNELERIRSENPDVEKILKESKVDNQQALSWVESSACQGSNRLVERASKLLKILLRLHEIDLARDIQNVLLVEEDRLHASVTRRFVKEVKGWLHCDPWPARIHRRLRETANEDRGKLISYRQPNPNKNLQGTLQVVAIVGSKINNENKDVRFVDIDIDESNPCSSLASLCQHWIDILR